jgi:hypothetical protein
MSTNEMNESCPFEPNVLRAASTGEWTQALRAHVESCTGCAAASEVAAWMEDFARIDDRDHILPDPAVLWLKAKLLQSNAAIERAALPMTRMQIVAYFVLAGGWAALLTWKWNALRAWMLALNPGRIATGVAGTTGATSLSMTFLITLVLLASATAMLAFHTILAEE